MIEALQFNIHKLFNKIDGLQFNVYIVFSMFEDLQCPKSTFLPLKVVKHIKLYFHLIEGLQSHKSIKLSSIEWIQDDYTPIFDSLEGLLSDKKDMNN